MDAGKLFAQLMNRGESASGGILTGTAVSDSVDGSVMVQMDGSVVAQPSEDETELVVSAEEFADGTYVLPSVPYAGTLTVSDANDSQLEEDEYDLDGSTLTIHALSSAPVDVSYETNVQQVLTNSDFDGDTYSLPSTTNLTVREDGVAVPYTLDGNLLTIEGIEHVTGVVEFAYTYDVSQVCSAGVNVLPNAPDDVAVFGRNSSGVDVVVTDYVLSGSTITLSDTYDAYTVDYPVSMVERWNVSDQYQQIPLEDSDDAAGPETVTIGHNLQWEPSSVTSCTVDGVSTTYTLDVANVVVDAPTITERFITLTYDLPVRMQVPASSFAVGPFTLPSVPVGSVITTMGGSVLANTVDDTQLTIDSLLTDSPTYTLTYTEQVEQDTVELPCTPYVAAGQFVEIAVVNGMPTVIGASGSGDVTMTLAGDAADAAAAAEEAAAAAQEVAEAMNQHFWTDSNGVHVTEVTQEEWAVTPSGANQLSNSEGILLRDGLNPIVSIATGASSGMSVFDGTGSASTNVLATFTEDGITLGRSTGVQTTITATGTTVQNSSIAPASFGILNDAETGLATITESGSATPITISGQTGYGITLSDRPTSIVSATVNGAAASSWEVSSASGLIIVDGAASGDAIVVTYLTADSVAFAQFGEGSSATGSSAVALGEDARATGTGAIAVGYWTRATGESAVALGMNATASGYGAVGMSAFGDASGGYSHTEGYDCDASAYYSHAEGYACHALWTAAHAEGHSSYASGAAAHAQNTGTAATKDNQTAIGRWNVPDVYTSVTKQKALIIGNGTDNDNRSNALTVDWSGNVVTAGGATLSDNVTLYDGTGSLVYRSRSELLDRDSGTAPSSWQYADGLELLDKDGERVGRIYTAWNTSNAMGTGIEAITEDSNGNEVMNFLRVLANKDGSKTFSVGDRGNFRAAISAARADWVSLGTATGTGSRTIDLTGYNEVMVAAKANGKLVTATVAKPLLTSSTQELWLGGGKSANGVANAGNLRAVCNISLTTVKGVDFSDGNTNRTSSTTWYVYAR